MKCTNTPTVTGDFGVDFELDHADVKHPDGMPLGLRRQPSGYPRSAAMRWWTRLSRIADVIQIGDLGIPAIISGVFMLWSLLQGQSGSWIALSGLVALSATIALWRQFRDSWPGWPHARSYGLVGFVIAVILGLWAIESYKNEPTVANKVEVAKPILPATEGPAIQWLEGKQFAKVSELK